MPGIRPWSAGHLQANNHTNLERLNDFSAAQNQAQPQNQSKSGTGRLRLSLDPPGAHGAAEQHHRSIHLKRSMLYTLIACKAVSPRTKSCKSWEW